MLEGKSSPNYTNLFSPKGYEKNDKIFSVAKCSNQKDLFRYFWKVQKI